MTTALESPPVAETGLDGVQQFQQRMLLLAPTCGWWRGHYQLPKHRTSATLDGAAIAAGNTTTGQSVLMVGQVAARRREDRQTFPNRGGDGRAWYDIFSDIEQAQKTLIENFSIPFPIRGVRIIPKSAGAAFLAAMFGRTVGLVRRELIAARATNDAERIRRLENELGVVHDLPDATPIYDARRENQAPAYQMRVAAEEFCDNWEQHLRTIQSRTDPLVWDAIGRKVPTDPAKLRDKFYMDVTPVEIAGGEPAAVTAADLNDHIAIVREAARRKVEEAITAMVAEPREELGQALSELQELIDRDGRVTNRSFNGVRAAMAKIRLFADVANPELLDRIAAFEQRLQLTTASTLDRATSASSGFSRALTAFRQEVTDSVTYAEDVERFGGRPIRGIEI